MGLNVILNISIVKFVVNENLLVNVLTLLSIVFGFVISAICNLFGRKITYEMSVRRSASDGGISQLQMIKKDVSQILGCSMSLIIMSLGVLMTKDNANFERFYTCDYCRYAGSAMYAFLLFFVLFALYSYAIILMNWLINETYLSGKQ